MITVTHRDSLRQGAAGTARFEGAHHGAGMSFFWVDSEPGGGPERHVHPYSETWVVISGVAELTADDERMTATAGDIVTVSAGTVHRFRSAGPERLEMVCIHSSPTIIQDFVDAAASATATG